jgi:hypothetical protein
VITKRGANIDIDGIGTETITGMTGVVQDSISVSARLTDMDIMTGGVTTIATNAASMRASKKALGGMNRRGPFLSAMFQSVKSIFYIPRNQLLGRMDNFRRPFSAAGDKKHDFALSAIDDFAPNPSRTPWRSGLPS